jgi:hypothetical protein
VEKLVTPAQAGVQVEVRIKRVDGYWMPAFAGMTN